MAILSIFDEYIGHLQLNKGATQPTLTTTIKYKNWYSKDAWRTPDKAYAKIIFSTKEENFEPKTKKKKNRKEKDFERFILQPCPLTFDGRYTPKPVSYNSSPAWSKQS